MGYRISAVKDSAKQKLLGWSDGKFVVFIFGCLFGIDMTFWVINGVVDISTSMTIGAIVDLNDLALKVLAYLMLVPLVILLRVMYFYVTEPKAVKSGECPDKQEVLSLDHMTAGILLVSLPRALSSFGGWIFAATVYIVGVFVLPKMTSDENLQDAIKFSSVIVAMVSFLYITNGDLLPLPDPELIYGPFANITLPDSQVQQFLRITHSILFGPFVVALFALSFNAVFTSQPVRTIPLFRISTPNRSPFFVVYTSAFIGAVFFNILRSFYIGEIQILF